MKCYAVQQKGVSLAHPVFLADSFGARFRGLMLRKALMPGEGLLLKNCSSIHCCFMRFPIDVIYLDRSMTVLGRETVPPWRVGGHFPGTRHVLELEKGRGALFELGTTIQLTEENRNE